MVETSARVQSASPTRVHAPPPRTATTISSRAGMKITPPTTWSPRSIATSVEYNGTPQMNDLVPSIGSMTQRYSDDPSASSNSSPWIESSAKRPAIIRLAICSALRSAIVTGLSSPLRSTDRSRRRKCSSVDRPAAIAMSISAADRPSCSGSCIATVWDRTDGTYTTHMSCSSCRSYSIAGSAFPSPPGFRHEYTNNNTAPTTR